MKQLSSLPPETVYDIIDGNRALQTVLSDRAQEDTYDRLNEYYAALSPAIDTQQSHMVINERAEIHLLNLSSHPDAIPAIRKVQDQYGIISDDALPHFVALLKDVETFVSSLDEITDETFDKACLEQDEIEDMLANAFTELARFSLTSEDMLNYFESKSEEFDDLFVDDELRGVFRRQPEYLEIK